MRRFLRLFVICKAVTTMPWGIFGPVTWKTRGGKGRVTFFGFWFILPSLAVLALSRRDRQLSEDTLTRDTVLVEDNREQIELEDSSRHERYP